MVTNDPDGATEIDVLLSTSQLSYPSDNHLDLSEALPRDTGSSN